MRQFLHPQERESTCAMAAIRTVLHKQFGLRISESALVALGNSPHEPILQHGSATTEIRRAVRGASRAFNTGTPWTLRTRTDGTIRKLIAALAGGRWPIVEVNESQLHAIVVVEIRGDRVRFFDPGISKPTIRSMSRERFMQYWLRPSTTYRWWALINGGELKDGTK